MVALFRKVDVYVHLIYSRSIALPLISFSHPTTVLLKIFKRHQKEERVIIPLLKTMDKLLDSGLDMTLLANDKINFARDLLHHLKVEARGCSAVPRLLAIIDVSLALLSSCSSRSSTLSFLLGFLGHPFPRVRRYTAEQFYTKLIENDDYTIVAGSESTCDACTNILLEVEWEDTADGAQGPISARDELAKQIGVELDLRDQPKVHAGTTGRHTDEFSSYMSLVKEAGR
jgi:hypothetical protein